MTPAAMPAIQDPLVPRPAPLPLRQVEQRAFPRVKVQAEVTLASESNFYTGFSGDLSEGGVFVATYEKLLGPGTHVDIAIALPGLPTLRVPGVVKWVRDLNQDIPGVFPGMGIGFENVNPEVQAAIKTFLSQREPMFYDE